MKITVQAIGMTPHTSLEEFLEKKLVNWINFTIKSKLVRFSKNGKLNGQGK